MSMPSMGLVSILGGVDFTGHTSETSKNLTAMQQMFELLTERRVEKASKEAIENKDYRLAAMMTTVAGTRRWNSALD